MPAAKPSIWTVPAAELERREAEARGVTREEMVRVACERYRRVLEGMGVEESTRKVTGE